MSMLFANGTEAMNWKYLNCERCVKGYITAWSCPLEQAIDFAAIDDGVVAPDIAQRLHTSATGRGPALRCPEYQSEAVRS